MAGKMVLISPEGPRCSEGHGIPRCVCEVKLPRWTRMLAFAKAHPLVITEDNSHPGHDCVIKTDLSRLLASTRVMNHPGHESCVLLGFIKDKRFVNAIDTAITRIVLEETPKYTGPLPTIEPIEINLPPLAGGGAVEQPPAPGGLPAGQPAARNALRDLARVVELPPELRRIRKFPGRHKLFGVLWKANPVGPHGRFREYVPDQEALRAAEARTPARYDQQQKAAYIMDFARKRALKLGPENGRFVEIAEEFKRYWEQYKRQVNVAARMQIAVGAPALQPDEE